ncbi:MAG: glycosyltransferase [Acetobacteraceae bacterium]|nr:glycosyltransferase [Acetobacteraceae bacterium]
MPAFNAQAYIRQSVQSVLAQTCENFELLVVDDGSTDNTRAIVAAIDDPRVRIIDSPGNCGVVAARNRGIAAARGRYIAIHDADDISVPNRFVRQVEYLDTHETVAGVCARQSILEHGTVRFLRAPAGTDPLVVRAVLHFSNPIGHASLMFRAASVAALGVYQREDMAYAEDFDFLHRLLAVGEICELPEYLVLYRRHEANISRLRRITMLERTAAVLQQAYARLLGETCADEARLMANHMVAQEPFADAGQMVRTGRFLDRIIDALGDRHALTAPQRLEVTRRAARLWWGVVQSSVRAGQFVMPLRHHGAFSAAASGRPPLRRIAWAALAGFATNRLGVSRPQTRPTNAVRPSLRIGGVEFHPVPPSQEPPTLYVVIDTEAEIDRTEAAGRAVSAMHQQAPAQRLFDAWGVRPVYVADDAVASRPEGYEPLRAILDRHGCVIGAQMHAGVTPPFEEARKLRSLVAAIERNFGVTPLFFRAGRHGVGPNTMGLLGDVGFQVDFSLLPHADLRAQGGPDLRRVECVPYRAGGVLSVPMTRGLIGARSPRLHPQGMLARLGLANTVTLTPEGFSAAEQMQLIDAMIRRGCRTFALHYHSASLAKQTPHVRNAAELAEFIGRIEAVGTHFFQVHGGLPGNPADLLPPEMRGRVWPRKKFLF